MKTIPTLTPNEITNLLDYTMANHYTHSKHRQSVRNTAIILLMLDAGLRVGEVVQLKIGDLYQLNEPVKWLRIRASLTKTQQERCIPLNDAIQSAIAHLNISYWPYYGLDHDNYAFTGASKSKHLTVRQVQHTIDRLSRASIKRSIRPHVLRHTFATRLMRTTNVRIVQELLGHRQISSTQIYTHPNQNDLLKAISSNSSI